MTFCSQSPNQHSTSNSSSKYTGVNLDNTCDRAAPNLCLSKAEKSLYHSEEKWQENTAVSVGRNCFSYERTIVLPYQKLCLQDFSGQMNIKNILKLNKTNKQE